MISQTNIAIINNYVDRLNASVDASKTEHEKRAEHIIKVRWMFVNVLCNRSINWADDDDRTVWLKHALEDLRMAWFEAKEGNTEQAADTIMK